MVDPFSGEAVGTDAKGIDELTGTDEVEAAEGLDARGTTMGIAGPELEAPSGVEDAAELKDSAVVEGALGLEASIEVEAAAGLEG